MISLYGVAACIGASMCVVCVCVCVCVHVLVCTCASVRTAPTVNNLDL